MKTSNNLEMTIEEFASMLERHGTDAVHWPSGRRQNMLSFCQDNARARACLNEMGALQRVLELAGRAAQRQSNASPDRQLVKQILAKTTAVAVDAAVIAIGPEIPKLVTVTAAAAPQPDPAPDVANIQYAPSGRGELWRHATLLAASLIIGLLIGFNASGVASNEILAQVASLTGSNVAQTIGLEASELSLSELDEDTL